MPTNDERREVAAKLRDMACRANPSWPALMDLLKCPGRAVVVQYLADLIEPEERTCRMVGDHLTDTAYCSVCGERFDSVAQYMAMVQLPYSVTDYEPEYKDARYCPNCGAKVVVE